MTVFKTNDYEYVTVAGFARLFGVSNMTIYRMVARGDIRAMRVGRQFRIPLPEVKRCEKMFWAAG